MPPFLDLTPRDAGPLQQEPAVEFHVDSAPHFIPECPLSVICRQTSNVCGYTSG